MKLIFALVMFVTVHSFAFAEGVTAIQKGDISLSQGNAKITSVVEICPALPGRPTCAAYGSVVKIKVTLNGCLDRLGGYFSKFEVVDNKGILHFGAINIFNEASRRTRCVQAPTEFVTVMIPFEGEVELQEMDYVGNILPQY